MLYRLPKITRGQLPALPHLQNLHLILCREAASHTHTTLVLDMHTKQPVCTLFGYSLPCRSQHEDLIVEPRWCRACHVEAAPHTRRTTNREETKIGSS
jgi:hypothetical protein